MMDSTLPVSQSIEPHAINELRSEITELRKELSNVNAILKYLATANVELTQDMQIIYDSLKQISFSVDESSDLSDFSFVDPDDDEILN
tara:strand:- start:82 stop:345 length:264 start_codon:yes stop_codon:yes gene_type:complete